MIIFFRKIPEHTTKEELQNFISPALVRFGFLSIGKILKIEFLISVNPHLKTHQWNALVHVDSKKAGQAIIKKFHKSYFNHRFLVVREYVKRSLKNDPRLKKHTLENIKSKRISDRRLKREY